MEAFIGGLPRSIEGNVTASKPQTLEEAITITQRLMDQVTKHDAEQGTNDHKRKFDDRRNNNNTNYPNNRDNNNYPNDRNNNNYQNNRNNNNNNRNNDYHQQQNGRQETFRTYGNRGYNRPHPLCRKCTLHHTGPCTVRKGRLETIYYGQIQGTSNKDHGMDEGKRNFWEVIRTKVFGGNANSKKMQKAIFKQQFEAFTISSSEGLEKGYDRFQQLLSQLEAHEDLDLLHEDLEQIDDVDIRMKKLYKKTGRRVQIDGNKPVGFDKKKLECFKCHNTGHFARECTSKGTNDGKKRDSFYQDQGAGKKEQNQNCLLTMDDGVVNWGEHTVEEEETNHALMAISSNNELGEQEAKILAYTLAVKKLEAQVVTFQKQQLSLNEQLTFQANEIYAKDEKLKKYRRIGMKAVKEKEQLQKTVDSWKNSSKNLWKLVDSGELLQKVIVGLGYEIQSNNEVLSYEEEMNRTVFKCTEEDFLNKPLYNRFSKTNNFKGVPHPLYGDYTPKPQEEIDDSLYVYGKKGPQKPEISDSDENSTEHSTCQSNDNE
ncbi:ribonuclease H-like domain-containing protein [Tanacetum coccineum]